MFKLCIVAIVLAVAAMASVDGAVSVYGYNYPPYYPYYGLGGLVPVTGSAVESKKVEGKADAAPISSYLIDPMYAGYRLAGYPYPAGYPYVGYPYGPAFPRFIRDADKKVDGLKIEEPKV